MTGERAWFVYDRRGGKISAMPIRAAGWIALGAAITLPMLLGLAVRQIGLQPWVSLLVTLVAVGISLAVLFRLVIRFGRRS